MTGWALAACIACALAGMAILTEERIYRARCLNAMRKMRGSALYAELYEMLTLLNDKNLDEVRIERDRISFSGINPPGRLADFNLAERGYRFLDQDRILALVQVLALDLPALQNTRNYRLSRYYVTRPNGTRDSAYHYTAKGEYKMKVLSAHTVMRYSN